jgi:hypothetical protein
MTYKTTVKADYPNVPIVDARKPKDVEVITRDITRAKVADPRHCAFANACKREDGKVVEAIFWKTTCYLVYKSKIVRYKLPPSMQSEVVAFDRGGSFATGTYRLVAPPPSVRIGVHRSTARTGNGGMARPDRPHHRTVMVRDPR